MCASFGVALLANFIASALGGGASSCAAVNAEVLETLLRAGVTGRIDLIGIGDSNQGHGGTGWDHGWQAALSRRFPMYATGWLGQGPTAIGYKYACLGPLSTMGAPPELDTFFDVDRSVILPRYAWRDSGATTQRVEFYLDASIPLDMGATIILRRQIGLFPDLTFPGPGSFREFLRRGDTSVPLMTTPVIFTAVTGSGEAFLMDTHEMGWAPVLAPDPARRGVPLQWFSGRQGFPDVVGPFFTGLSCVENADADAGFSYTTLVYGGGKSLRDMAFALQENRAQPMLINLFARVRARQPQAEKMVAFTINSGLNDRNETEISVGPNPTLPGKSPQAFRDNASAVIGSLLSAWNAAGGDESEVYFILTGSHPVHDADENGEYPEAEALLRAYRREFADIALVQPRTTALILDEITTSAEMSAQGWYVSANDLVHLSVSGFEALAARQLAALEARAGCWADLNPDHRIDVEDLYRHAQTPSDLNLDGAATSEEAGCLVRAIRWFEGSDVLSEGAP